MESLIKNYYKHPKSNINVIRKAIYRKKIIDKLFLLINSTIISLWIIYFVYFMFLLNINFLNIVITVFFSLGSIFLFICEIILWLSIFIVKYYLILSVISISLFIYNLIVLEQRI